MKKSGELKLITLFITAVFILNQAVFLLAPTNSVQAQYTSNLDINIKHPSSGALVSGNTEVRVQIKIDGTIIAVDEVYLHWPGSSMGQAIMSYQGSVFGYYYNWDTTTFPDGQYYLEAIAMHGGQYYYSNQTILTVKNNTVQPPQVTIINPLDNKTVSGQQTVKVEVIPNDNIKGAYLYWPGSGMDYKTMTYVSGNLYTYGWDTTQWANNSYEIYAYVKYGSSLQTEYSPSINVIVNNSTIQDLTVIITSPANNVFVSDTISIQAEINLEADSAYYEILDEQNNLLVSHPATISGNAFFYDWDTTALVNGTYKIKAYAHYSEQIKSDIIYVNVYNETLLPDEEPATTTPDLGIHFIDYPSQITGSTIFSIQTNTEVDSVGFYITGPKNQSYPATYAGSNKYYFVWDTTNFSSGIYQVKAMAQKGEQSVYNHINVNLGEADPGETKPTVLDNDVEIKKIKEESQEENIFQSTETELIQKRLIVETPDSLQSENEIIKPGIGWPDLNIGVDLKEEVKSFNEFKEQEPLIGEFLPEECRENNISSERECQKYLQLTQECWEARIFNNQECKKYMYHQGMPEECRQAGAIDQEECSNIIMLNSMPIECQKAGIITIEECRSLLKEEGYVSTEYNEAKVEHFDKEDEVIKKIYLPQECRDLGIDDEKQCEYYLEQRYVLEECRQAGAETRDECDKAMFKKYGLKECFSAGIEDEQECMSFVFNKYAPQIICQGMDAWQCKNFVKERYLGDIVAKQTFFKELKEQIKEKAGETFKSGELTEIIAEGEGMIPVKEKEINLRVLFTEQQVVLDKNNNIVQTAPIALVVDSDSDGLSDDMEKRLGTNPLEADTDGDGYNDGEEVKKNFNPAGGGLLAKTIAPIEQAIIENKSLGQPKAEGKIAEEFVVKAATNIKGTNIATSTGYVFVGQAEANSIITLYIYSDLPLVATVQVDEYGNWLYEFQQSLIEGEHEVYIALNDNTGKVIKKSNPFHFFVKEAKAVSVKDFVSSATAETSKKSESLINFYLIIASLVIVVGILLFIIFFLLYKNRQQPKY